MVSIQPLHVTGQLRLQLSIQSSGPHVNCVVRRRRRRDVRCFNLLLSVVVVVVPACTSSGPDQGPGGREGGGASLVTARPGLQATWTAYDVTDGFVPPPGPAKVAKGKFDRVRSGMTLRELTDLLGRGWMSQYAGCGIITWSGEDGRELQVWPTTGRPEEVLDAGPRQVAGAGGRGRMCLTKPGADGELQDLPIPPK